MGGTILCSAFERFGTLLECYVATRALAITWPIVWMIFVVPVKLVVRIMLHYCNTRELVVPLAHKKTEGPSTILTFGGIVLDTASAVSRLSQEKRQCLQVLVAACLGQIKATLSEFQVSLRHLNFECRVVVSGRAFCNCLYMATAEVLRPYHFISMNWEGKEDLLMWCSFLQSYNGVSFWRQLMVLQAQLQVHVNTAVGTSLGILGGVSGVPKPGQSSG